MHRNGRAVAGRARPSPRPLPGFFVTTRGATGTPGDVAGDALDETLVSTVARVGISATLERSSCTCESGIPPFLLAGEGEVDGGDSRGLAAITVVQNLRGVPLTVDAEAPFLVGDSAFRITEPETVRFTPPLDGRGGGSRGSLGGFGVWSADPFCAITTRGSTSISGTGSRRRTSSTTYPDAEASERKWAIAASRRALRLFRGAGGKTGGA